MEWLESLFPLLLLLIYFLAQARKRGAKRQATAAESPAGETHDVQQPRKPTPFQDIIRQIQEAAEQAQLQQQKPRPEVTSASFATPEVILPPSPPAQSPGSSEFREQGGFEHDEHGFGKANPFSEEGFESKPASPDPPAHAPGHLSYSPHESLGDSSTLGLGRRRPHRLIERLSKPEGLKEALILKEILDRPRRLR